MGVLGHSATLVGVKEDIVDIKRSSNKGLVVGSGDINGSTFLTAKIIDSP